MGRGEIGCVLGCNYVVGMPRVTKGNQWEVSRGVIRGRVGERIWGGFGEGSRAVWGGFRRVSRVSGGQSPRGFPRVFLSCARGSLEGRFRCSGFPDTQEKSEF